MKGGVRLGALAAVLAVGTIAGLIATRDTPASFAPVDATGSPGSWCAPPPTPPPLDREIRLQVFRAAGVSEAEVGEQLELASAYHAAYGVRVLRSPTRSLDVTTLIDGSRAAVDEALRGAGIEPGAPVPEERRAEARRVTCEATLGPLRRFIADEADPNVLNLVVLRSIAEQGSAVAALLPDLRGLTLHASTTSPGLKACLGLGEGFASTVLLGLDAITTRRPGTVNVTLAHEIGHYLGLDHPLPGTSRNKVDLMAVEPPRCVPALTPAQIALIKGT